MWSLWCRTRGAMGGIGHLPERGGILDQHTPTMQALDVFSETWPWLDGRFPPDPKPHRTKARAG